jgi:ATP-dependent DNA helicase RecG
MTDVHFLEAVQGQTADRQPVRAAGADEIDPAKVAAHIERAVERGRYEGPRDPLAYLRHKKCIVEVDGKPYPTLAGILCFGRSPQEHFPRAVVDIGHYRGIDPVSYEVVHLEKDISGTIFDQLSRVEAYLWTNTHHGMTVTPGSFQRVEVHEYPQIVIRELCVNMLAHRDYTIHGSAARVMLFRNRIEWASPGGLPQGLNVENILNEQYSRNPAVLSILFEAGYVEAFGQGLDTVVAVSKQEGLSPPTFRDTGASFIVTAHGRPLDVFASDGIYAQLSDSQRKIIGLLRSRGEVPPRDIRELLQDRTERSIQRDIKSLINAKLVESVGGARAIRYRLNEDLTGGP